MFRLAARSLCALALALSLAGSAAALTEWNQAEVTTLAKELANSVSGLRDALRDSPQWTYPGQRTVLYQIRDDLRWIENEAQSLYAMLSKGEGMEATLNSYRRIQFLRRDAQSLAQRAQVTAFTEPQLAKARETLEKLASYYPAEDAN